MFLYKFYIILPEKHNSFRFVHKFIVFEDIFEKRIRNSDGSGGKLNSGGYFIGHISILKY